MKKTMHNLKIGVNSWKLGLRLKPLWQFGLYLLLCMLRGVTRHVISHVTASLNLDPTNKIKKKLTKQSSSQRKWTPATVSIS